MQEQSLMRKVRLIRRRPLLKLMKSAKVVLAQGALVKVQSLFSVLGSCRLDSLEVAIGSLALAVLCLSGTGGSLPMA